MRDGRIEYRLSIKRLEGMGSRSHYSGADQRMHSFSADCDTFSNEEKFAVVIPVTNDKEK